MEIKPQWLLEGELANVFLILSSLCASHAVAPHYFKPADLEQLATGDKKMPKTVGSAGEKARV